MALSGLTSPLIRATTFRMTVTLRLGSIVLVGVHVGRLRLAKRLHWKQSQRIVQRMTRRFLAIRHVGLHRIHVENAGRCAEPDREVSSATNFSFTSDGA